MSTKWCKGDQVAVYNLLFTRLDAENRTTIMKMFGLKKALDVHYHDVNATTDGVHRLWCICYSSYDIPHT